MQIGDDWNHYTFRYGDDGRRAKVRFDVERALLPTPPTHRRSVRVCVHGPCDGFEARLAQVLTAVDCWLVGVLDYAETTAFALQVEDLDAFLALRDAVGAAATGEVSFEESDGWGFFDDRVCPTPDDWQRIADREQLERLEAAGLDLALDRAVRHRFYGAPGALERIGQQLAGDGFERRAHGGERLALARVHRLVDVSRVSVPLARYARSEGVAYDGWTPE